MEGYTETRNGGMSVSVNEDICLEKCKRLNKVSVEEEAYRLKVPVGDI